MKGKWGGGEGDRIMLVKAPLDTLQRRATQKRKERFTNEWNDTVRPAMSIVK